MTRISREVKTLPPKAVVFFKFNFDTKLYNFLLKQCSHSKFVNISNFIIFKDLSVGESFIEKIMDNNKITDISLIPAYIKFNNMFITFPNYKKLISTLKKNELEQKMIAYLSFPFLSFNSSIDNMPDLLSLIHGEKEKNMNKNNA